MAVALRQVKANGVELNVALAGEGPAVLLLHGFPHTWQLWTHVLDGLAGRYRVIAPDLRGCGASARTAGGYDAGTLAADAEALLDALGETSAAVVGIDAGTPPAFLLAMRRPDLVRRLVVMESLVGRLPGAEEFLAHGAPWWFGFHSAPGLAESVLTGHEDRYIDWFLDAGTLGQGVDPAVRDAFVHAYTGTEALRCAFSYYRALPESSRQIQEAVRTARLTVPTMAIGAHPVGSALEQQLRPVTDHLSGHVIENCGHIIPLHRPDRLLALLEPFLALAGSAGSTGSRGQLQHHGRRQ
ncbi:pimeloyl-ACP methyl ester carboxylesterase [Streptomyces sp. Ag82_O1-15]|jgi:pimeloyl-ACP methyl ester carboxylesterase|uniref:alpha/beta fold hydrolase n=1 Tax=Streptomyces sp. Ag82_O1-15 TaxID=1938855 RepID=UPI000BB139D8|nr:alpha/beta hydrolase [Streptomyces sp. Ag82_O1-15]PBC99354.1 pimeloyl-ACP methyl ester carboxylesterase [Streptomyces sp. Ag82_O1-15]